MKRGDKKKDPDLYGFYDSKTHTVTICIEFIWYMYETMGCTPENTLMLIREKALRQGSLFFPVFKHEKGGEKNG